MQQFTVVAVKRAAPLGEKQKTPQVNHSESENVSDSSEKHISDAKDGHKENGEGLQEKKHSPGVRKDEREVDIAPGERLSVKVACQAK